MASGNPSILVIEDSPEDYEALVRALTKAGVVNPVYRFSYGEDAFDFLKQRGRYFKIGSERPALLILDLNLPGSDGLRVLQEIRSDPELRALPVIILSTSANPTEIDAAYRGGANSYIVKPSSPEEFLQAVRVMKNYWLDLVRLPEGVGRDTGDGFQAPAPETKIGVFGETPRRVSRPPI